MLFYDKKGWGECQGETGKRAYLFKPLIGLIQKLQLPV